MAFDFSTLVTDRTQQDVAYAKQFIDKLVTGTATEAELAEWNAAALKGSYNASDLNRVGAAMDYLVGRLKSRGINVELKRSEIKHQRDTVAEVERTITLTADNVAQFFTVSNGTYYFVPSGGTWTTNNGGSNDSTASTTFTALRDMSVSFGYSYSSEQNYDLFNLSVAGVAVETDASGVTTTKAYSAEIKQGDTVVVSYKKDGSQHKNDDKCTLFDFVATYKETIVVPDGRDPYIWFEDDIPTAELLNEHLGNVSAMRSALRVAFPEIPADMDDGLTIEEANNIEVVLVTIEQFITNMLATYRHCGVTVSGMGGLFF